MIDKDDAVVAVNGIIDELMFYAYDETLSVSILERNRASLNELSNSFPEFSWEEFNNILDLFSSWLNGNRITLFDIEIEAEAVKTRLSFYYDYYCLPNENDESIYLDDILDNLLIDEPSDENNDDEEITSISEVEYYHLIESFVKDSKNSIATRQMIKEAFPNLTFNVINRATLYTPVVNMNGYYTHLDAFDLSDHEIKVWKEQLHCLIREAKPYHSKDIYPSLRRELSGTFGRIGITHYLQMFYISKKLFYSDFQFQNPYIALKGVTIFSFDVLLHNKVIEDGVIDVNDFSLFSKEIGAKFSSFISFVDCHNDIAFLNRTQMVSVEVLGWTKESFADLEAIVSNFLGDREYRPVDEFISYNELPQYDFRWNEWLLYSAIRLFTRKQFTLVTSTNTLSTARPYVCKKGVNINNIKFDNDYRPSDHYDDDLLDFLDYDDLEMKESDLNFILDEDLQ